ncbi:FAD-dependent oxidoreductase [Cyanobium sp. AMD-g]|uniref:NAD(P)/FAD-dependent oxidoreductase n=1 Tax=Cyanobium sp. AMD-g TaxID=2823699 RepID=UPI0020CF082A|nr:FAD-dependent oxidoreductase [Cyanobium sp. AMD-g]MCP9929864.1 FAD-dependent oxidoreductase [Cyanobium sp. AMD-g]
MLRLSELKLPLDHSAADLEVAISQRLRLAPGELRRHQLVKRSVDARRRGAISLVYCLDLELEGGARRRLLRRFAGDPHLRPTPDSRYRPVARADGTSEALRPVVVGAGPCGYFAALLLAQMGWRPLLLERGKVVKERTADTFGFWHGRRRFDPGSNAQFGEGGAGTFSDGKLYSQVSEEPAYIRKVLEELVAAGADPDILTLHHPHIGTFKLATVVRGLRARIEALGGEVRFGQHVVELLLEDGADRRLAGVRLADGTAIATRHLVLAPGHSARDTFQMLHGLGVAMEPKAFAVGVRIEHPQVLVDRARWGEAAGHPRLGPAEYKLVHHCKGNATAGRSVYSFCMCPGGLVVGATSEEGCVVTNGMSQHSRRERNANSGLVVPVSQEDLAPYGQPGAEALAGMAFQRHWEQQAFRLGGGDYRAPAQWLGDFLAGRASQEAPPGAVEGSYRPGLRFGSLDGCLPDYVLEAIREALPVFARRIPGYAMEGALLTGVETRTSSPLRLQRHPTRLESLNTPGLFPAGEGGGHAGGILSAAIDGIKVAEAVALSLCAPALTGTPPHSTARP